MSNEDKGWISLYRSLGDSSLWLKEKFTRGQAWVDLLMLANHKDGWFMVRDNRVDVKRGQIGRSILSLADRWKWSQGKVKRFLKMLENDDQIREQNSNVTTLITLINYDTYQKTESRTESRRRADGEQTETNNNENNANNKNSVVFSLPDWIDKSLWDSYVSMRIKISKPITSQIGAEGLFKSLKKLVDDGFDQKDCFQAALSGSWQNFYEPKVEKVVVDTTNGQAFCGQCVSYADKCSYKAYGQNACKDFKRA